MKILTTPDELMDRLAWDKACDLLGYSVWAVNEGQMESDAEITLTEEQARALGLISRKGD